MLTRRANRAFGSRGMGYELVRFRPAIAAESSCPSRMMIPRRQRSSARCCCWVGIRNCGIRTCWIRFERAVSRV